MILLYVLIFILSCLAIAWSGSRLVDGLAKMAKYLNWREFVVAFFIMAVAGSFPNLFVGINSALHKIPQLSFGDIVGGNMIDLTLAVAAAIIIGGVSLPAKSRLVQSSAIFTAGIAILPLILILDGALGRIDGLILLLTFFIYIVWLFSKSERFKKVYNGNEKKEKTVIKFKDFLKNLFLVILALILLLLGSEGIVISAQVFAKTLEITLPLVGILIIGFGNALPEIYFAVISARKKQTWMILGDLMGAVIISATFVLGIVVLINPIRIVDFSPFAIARIFLIISALFFLIVVRTGRRVSKKESLILLGTYLLFLFFEIFFR